MPCLSSPLLQVCCNAISKAKKVVSTDTPAVPTTLRTQSIVASSTSSLDSHNVVSDGVKDIDAEFRAILRRNGINDKHVANITDLNTRGWPDVCNVDLGDVPAYFDLGEQAQVVCCPSGSTWAYYGGNEIGIVCCGPTGIDSCNWAPVPAEVKGVSHKPNCGAIGGARYNKGGNWPVCILPHHKREGERAVDSAPAITRAIEARGWPNVCDAGSIPQYFDQSGGHYVICCASDSNWAEPHSSPLGTYISCCSIAPSQPGLCKVVPKAAGYPKCGNIAGAYNNVFNDPNVGDSHVCLLPHGAEAGTQSQRSVNALQTRGWPNVCLENQVPQYFDAFDQPHVVCCPTDSNSAYWDNTNGPSCCKPDPKNPDGPCIREDAITKNDDNFPECSNIPGASLDLRSGIHTCKLPHSKRAVPRVSLTKTLSSRFEHTGFRRCLFCEPAPSVLWLERYPSCRLLPTRQRVGLHQQPRRATVLQTQRSASWNTLSRRSPDQGPQTITFRLVATLQALCWMSSKVSILVYCHPLTRTTKKWTSNVELSVLVTRVIHLTVAQHEDSSWHRTIMQPSNRLMLR